MLLLDEPTNHLDAESVAWLEKHLQNYNGTVVMVTHDRYFLDNVTGWILELDRGQGIPYEGNYSSWLEQKQKRLEQEAKEESARQRTLANELEWIRKNPKARQAKSKARINAYDELLSAATKDKITQAHINIPMTERLGDLVIEANNISKGYGDRLLNDNLSFKIPKGAIVGIIGPNGAGKTTLFRMITGQEKPDSGEIRIGATVDLGYVDQTRDELNADKNVWEEISDGLDIIQVCKKEMPSRAYGGQFNFYPYYPCPDFQCTAGCSCMGHRTCWLYAECAVWCTFRSGGNSTDANGYRSHVRRCKYHGCCIGRNGCF